MTKTWGEPRTASDGIRQADRDRLRAVSRGPVAVVADARAVESLANSLDTMQQINLFCRAVGTAGEPAGVECDTGQVDEQENATGIAGRKPFYTWSSLK